MLLVKNGHEIACEYDRSVTQLQIAAEVEEEEEALWTKRKNWRRQEGGPTRSAEGPEDRGQERVA